MSILSVRLRRTAPHPAGYRPPLPARLGGAALALALLAAPAALHAQTVRGDLVMTNGTVSAEVIAQMTGGHDRLIRLALAHVGKLP